MPFTSLQSVTLLSLLSLSNLFIRSASTSPAQVTPSTLPLALHQLVVVNSAGDAVIRLKGYATGSSQVRFFNADNLIKPKTLYPSLNPFSQFYIPFENINPIPFQNS